MKDAMVVQVDAEGCLVLPKSVRRATGVTGETRLLLRLEGKEVRLSPIRSAVWRAQEDIKARIAEDVSLVDELLEERRAAARAQDLCARNVQDDATSDDVLHDCRAEARREEKRARKKRG